MVQTINAVFDGTVLRPNAPLTLEANTTVRLTVETLSDEEIQRDQADARFAAILEAEFDPERDEEECRAVVEAELAGFEADGKSIALEDVVRQWEAEKAAKQATGRA